MKTIKFELFDDHVIVKEDAKVILLDTGSPATFSNEKSFFMAGYEFSGTTDQPLIERISNLLGRDIDVLLGMDNLDRFKILFDYKNEMLTFYEENETVDFQGEQNEIKMINQIPCVKLKIGENECTAFVDLGAKVSYYNNVLSGDFEEVGLLDDFYPMIGKFQTRAYRAPVQIGSANFDAVLGKLPDLLSMTLPALGVDGIIGSDLFKNFKVLMDFKKSSIYCQKY